MKRTCIITLLCLLGSSALSATEIKPYIKGNTPRQATSRVIQRAATQGERIMFEDFAKFSDGTEDAPGASIEFERNYYIPASMTAEDGWIGQGLFQAGGACLLGKRTDGFKPYGYIGTPDYDLGGNATLTLRARRAAGSNGNLEIMLIGEYGPTDDEGAITLTDSWQTYTFTATHGEFGEGSHFQIDAVDGPVLVDDISIDLTIDKLPTPTALPPRNMSPTQFVAQWEGTTKSYLLNVYYETIADNYVSGALFEDFNWINQKADDPSRIDTDDPSYPEGWSIDLATYGTHELATERGLYSSAPQSLVFDAEGDCIISPVTPQPVKSVSVWMRPSSIDQEFDFDIDDEYSQLYSLIQIAGYDSNTNRWIPLANIPNFYLTADGVGFKLEGRAVFGTNTTRIKIEYIQKNKLEFYVDDIIIEYESPMKKVSVVDNKLVSGKQYSVRNIDPELDHYYNVIAIDGDLVSDPSEDMWVDGIRGLRVTTDEPTDVSGTSFTANWQSMPHASEYSVDVYKVLEAKTDMPGYVINSENFDLITSGTVNNPGISSTTPYDFAANGMANTPWSATNPCWAAGMAGTTGTSWTGKAGLVYSPVLDMSANEGKGFDVTAKFYTTVESFDIGTDTPEPEGMFVMVLYTPDDTQALAADYFEPSQAGMQSHTFQIRNTEEIDLNGIIVAFMNKSGMPFFIDEVEISQDIKAGDNVVMPFSSHKTNATSMKVNNLEQGIDHGYAVTASTVRDYESYVSSRSDIRIVRTSTASVGNVAVDGDTMTVTALPGAIAVAGDGTARVFTPAGVQVGTVSADAPLSVATGIYIVATPSSTVKVSVK